MKKQIVSINTRVYRRIHEKKVPSMSVAEALANAKTIRTIKKR